MNERWSIRRLIPDDAAALMALRREALEQEPLAFAASPEDDVCRSLEFVRTALDDAQEQAVFGHFEQGELAGMVGVYRDGKLKHRHKAHVWGMYVAPRARRRGVGRALLEAAIEHVQEWPGIEQVQLSVSSAVPGAERLYEAVGLRVWGREPRALQWNGVFADESHIVLSLEQPR